MVRILLKAPKTFLTPHRLVPYDMIPLALALPAPRKSWANKRVGFQKTFAGNLLFEDVFSLLIYAKIKNLLGVFKQIITFF